MLSIVKTVFAGLLVAPCMLLASSAPRREASDSKLTKPAIKEATSVAPDFTLPDLKGQRIRSADLKGSVVVLDFWATWCVPCVGEIPAFNQLQEKYSRQGVKVIGLAVQSGWARDIKRFAAKYKMRYAILVGTDDTVGDFDVIGFPTTYVIAPGWKVFKKYSGAYPEKGNDIERDIQTLLTRNVSAKE